LIFIIAKNYPAALWQKYGRQVLRAQGALAWEALKAWRGAAARARLRGMLNGLLHLPRIWRKRRHVQALRTVSLAYLEGILSGPKQ
jgi:hypothetical protein